MEKYLEENCEKIDSYYITRQKDIKPIATLLWEQYDKKCPILKQEVLIDNLHVDHKHKRKSDIPSVENRLGFIRSHLFAGCNTFIGKIENAYKRFGLEDKIDLPTLLRNCADFIEKDPMEELGYNVLHYTEVPKREKVKVSEYNRVEKYFLELHPRKKKVPKKPTYVNQDWKDLVKKTDLHIQSLKKKQEDAKWVRKSFSDFKKENTIKINKDIKVNDLINYYHYLYNTIKVTIGHQYPNFNEQFNESQRIEIIENNTRINFSNKLLTQDALLQEINAVCKKD